MNLSKFDYLSIYVYFESRLLNMFSIISLYTLYTIHLQLYLSLVFLHALRIIRNLFLPLDLKKYFVCVVNFLKLLFIVTSSILFSRRFHILRIMHLIISTTHYVRILYFTFKIILIYSYI